MTDTNQAQKKPKNEYIVQVIAKGKGYEARGGDKIKRSTVTELDAAERLAEAIWGPGNHICYSLRHTFPTEPKYAHSWRLMRGLPDSVVAAQLKQVGYMTKRGAVYQGIGGPDDTPLYRLVLALDDHV